MRMDGCGNIELSSIGISSCAYLVYWLICVCITVEPLLRGHPDERPPPLERPLDNVNLNINVLISTPDERPPLLKGHFSGAKGVASREGIHCKTCFFVKVLSNVLVYKG